MNIFTRVKWWFQDQYYNIYDYFYKRKLKKLYPDYDGDNEYNCGELKFIWGIKSYDDLSSSAANIYTMNDIDICYDRKTDKYMLGVETAYMFKNPTEEVKYLERLLNAFTKYMDENGFDMNYEFMLWIGNPCTSMTASTIEELYTNFRIFVEGYKSLYGKED